LPETLFWILFFGIPVGCLVAICVSIAALRKHEGNGSYSFISLAISAMVLAVFGFWHFLGLGLGADYAPCLVDAAALAIASAFLARLLRRKSGA
jgi:hypothetical protein